MSADNNSLRFHMGCGERLQSRSWVVRCVSGVLLRTGLKSGEGKEKRDQRQSGEDRDES